MLQESNSCVIDQTTLKGNKTQIAIPPERKHRHLQRKERYEKSLKLLYLFVAITALYKPNRQLHNTKKLYQGFYRILVIMI